MPERLPCAHVGAPLFRLAGPFWRHALELPGRCDVSALTREVHSCPCSGMTAFLNPQMAFGHDGQLVTGVGLGSEPWVGACVCCQSNFRREAVLKWPAYAKYLSRPSSCCALGIEAKTRMAALRSISWPHTAELQAAHGTSVFPLAFRLPLQGLHCQMRTRQQKLLDKTREQRSNGRDRRRNGALNHSRAAMAPPRGITFPLPVDYTQVSVSTVVVERPCPWIIC